MAKRFTAQKKLQLVIESFKGDVNSSELCRKADIWPTQLNRYKNRVESKHERNEVKSKYILSLAKGMRALRREPSARAQAGGLSKGISRTER